MSRVIVKNLPADCREETLRDLASRVGTVTDVSLKFTKDGVFRKFAFVGFLTDVEAERAVKLLDKSFLQTARLSVQPAAALGDPLKPRAWSKYAKEVTEKLAASGKAESGEKGPKEKRKGNKIQEELKELEKDPEFAEFLRVHRVGAGKSVWDNDDGEITTKTKTAGAAGDAGEGPDKLEESESKKKKKKKRKKEEKGDSTLVGSTVVSGSDSDYLRSKMTKSDVFSDDDDDDDNNNDDDDAEKIVKSKKDNEDDVEEKVEDEMDDEKEDEEDEGIVEDVDRHASTSSVPAETYRVKMRGLPFNTKEKRIRSFFHPLKVTKVNFARWKKTNLGIAYAFFESKADLRSAMSRNKDIIDGRYIELFARTVKTPAPKKDPSSFSRDPAPWELKSAALSGEDDEALIESGRLFVRNLSYLCKEEDLTSLFSVHGPLVETHLPLDVSSKRPKGFAFVTFMMPQHAVKAFNALDGTVFQGRMLHLLPAKAKKEAEALGDDASFQKKKEAELKKRSNQSNSWNSLFLGSNAVADVVAQKYNSTKSAVLDSDARQSVAVRMALGETQIVNETRDFLVAHGIKLDSFGAGDRIERSKVCLLAKNLPAGTSTEEIADVFSPFGTLARLVIPPSGVTAIVEFQEAAEAKRAFKRLAFSKFKHLPLYLEWAPVDVFVPGAPLRKDAANKEELPSFTIDRIGDDSLTEESGATLYVKNVNFSTDEAALKSFFESVGPVVEAVVARHKDSKSGEILSRGYGFVQFRRSTDAAVALKTLQGKTLDGHALELKLSNRPSANPGKSRPAGAAAAASKTPSAKILVRNIPFEAKQKEIEELFKGFGDLKSVRLPKKVVGKGRHRGFAFVEFSIKGDAKRAFETFRHSTHLLGRRLVLEWADEEESVDGMRKRTADKFVGDDEEGGPRKMRKATVSSQDFLGGKKDGDD